MRNDAGEAFLIQLPTPLPSRWYNDIVNRNHWRNTLAKTRQTTLGRLATLFGATELTPPFWEQLEQTLIQADLGVGTVLPLLEYLRDEAKKEGFTHGQQVHTLLRTTLIGRLENGIEDDLNVKPRIILLIGVNGSGKTTTAARIAYHLLQENRSVLLVAADTYRAAASEQLEIWANRLEVDVLSGQQGSDPGAVVYDACNASLARGIDAVIVDTSGRMHTQHNLMQELQKIVRVAAKVIPGAPHQTLLVLDATTGQNGLAQAQAFTEAVAVSGVVLAKLDSSAKGGIAFAIASTLALPILYVGTGEKITDLSVFEPQAYIAGLLPEG